MPYNLYGDEIGLVTPGGKESFANTRLRYMQWGTNPNTAGFTESDKWTISADVGFDELDKKNVMVRNLCCIPSSSTTIS